jgi:DNA helicase-2/ATP-dependent DNA helicase PcrA
LVFSSAKSPKNPIEIDSVETKGNFDALNEDQRAAVESLSKSSMIIAGPGTGKTRTLIHKIAKLIQHGTDASQMVAVTFTNRAAGEMKDRLSTLLGKDLPLPFVGTFHGLGYRLLKDANQDHSNYGIADEKMRLALIQDSLKINDQLIKEIRINRKKLFEWIVSAKQNNVGPTDALDGISTEEKLFFKCYQTYQHLLEVNHLFDFEDLIFQPVRLLEANPSVGHKIKRTLNNIFIDEFQDINPGQYRLITLLSGNDGQLTVIGDPDQSIYGFRGSDMNCFSWLLKDRPDTEKIYLRQNYRSNETILQISHQVVRQNPEQVKIGGRQKLFRTNRENPPFNLWRGLRICLKLYPSGKPLKKWLAESDFFPWIAEPLMARKTINP